MRRVIAALAIGLFVPSLIFAEGLVTVSLDAARDGFFMRSFTGAFDISGAEKSGPFKYQGEGEKKFFQPSMFDGGLTTQAGLQVEGERIGGLFKLAVKNLSIPAHWINQQMVVPGDWGFWLKLGPRFDLAGLRLLTGSQAQRGQVNQYHNFSGFLNYKVSPVGILIPTNYETRLTGMGNVLLDSNFPYGQSGFGDPTGYAEFAASDANDLFVPAGSTDRLSGLLLDISAVPIPITVTASVGGLYEQLIKPLNTVWDSDLSEVSTNQSQNPNALTAEKNNFGFRVEGAELAGMVTIAAVYKYAHVKRKHLEPWDGNAIDFLFQRYAFGLYANIKPLNALGITVGYSGLYQMSENEFETTVPLKERNEFWMASYKKVIYPFYNGIDLRACFTGIPKSVITFNNNFTFADVNGSNANQTGEYSTSWLYEGNINETDAPNKDRKESYYALNNILGFQYAFNSAVTADVQVSSLLGIFSLDWAKEKKPTLTSLSHYLGAYAGFTYLFKEKTIRASLTGGLALRVASFSYQQPAMIMNESSGMLYHPIHKAGYMDFGIPLRLKVEY
jgi:hypothetical protein